MKRLALTLFVVLCNFPTAQAQTFSVEEARSIAKDAYIYGFPFVDNYRVQYSYFVDSNSPEFKGGWNKISNTARFSSIRRCFPS